MSRHWLYFGGFVVTAISLLGAGLLGVLDGLSALSGTAPTSEELVLLTMLAAAAEWVVIVLVLALVATLFLAATTVSVLRSASLPRDDRLVSLVEWVEDRVPFLRRFDVSEKVEPTTSDRAERVKAQYVDGELTEAEFERKMERLMDDSEGGPSRPEPEAGTEPDGRTGRP